MGCLMRSTTAGTISIWAVIAPFLAGKPTADGRVEVERAAGDVVAGAADDDGLAVPRPGTTADIRRVVTALDASDKAIALFEAASLSIREAPAPRRPFFGHRIRCRRDCHSTTIAQPSHCLRCRQTLARRFWWWSFHPSIPPFEAKMDPNFMMKVIGDRAAGQGTSCQTSADAPHAN